MMMIMKTMMIMMIIIFIIIRVEYHGEIIESRVTTLRPENATVANCGSSTTVINFDLNFYDLGHFLLLVPTPCPIASLICFLPHSILFILTGRSVVSTIVTLSTRFSVFNREIDEIWDPSLLKRYAK